jgi:hypothetical protein
MFAHGGGITMEFEAKHNRTQLMAMLMTIVVVGGVIAYAMMA